ncbi:Imm10 family immunity protein [uncultured Pseudomonas sp.]|uniref:Imm10 family immunity protein n=1 Tax=uncultured Pseudomonas sp. TaxID=114707 RepID=UPI0026003DDD|nr:Imm10 family immunity protein [uncultured Pseudomonas sp.]
MNIRFTARCHECFVEDEVLIVGFADSKSDPGDYLILQRAEAFDEQDRRLGMATYYVETAQPGLAGYGGVERVELAAGRLRLVFAPATPWCRDLQQVEILLGPPLDDLDAVERSLAGIFPDALPAIIRH